ncbi:MAG: hypothetical protein ACRDFT_00920 [bacterium]
MILSQRGLTRLAVVGATLVAVNAAGASATDKHLLPQLGFISFCKTTMAELTARLGPGTDLGDEYTRTHWVIRGWSNAQERVYLRVEAVSAEDAKNRELKGTPPIVGATLATAGHAAADQIRVENLSRPRLSLTLLRGPKGIRLGDSKSSVFRILGAGELQGRRADIETYNYYDLYPQPRRPGCAVAGFILQITFTGGKLTRIYVLEAS